MAQKRNLVGYGMDIPGVNPGGDNLFNANTQPNYNMDQGGDQQTQPFGGFQPINIPPPALPTGPVNPNPASPPIVNNVNGGTSPTLNQYGGSANLDPAYMRQYGMDRWAQLGFGKPSDAQLDELLMYAGRPDKFSNGTTHVGVNDYWINRIALGSEAADPNLAGNDTLLQNYTGPLPEAGFNQAHGMGSGARGIGLSPLPDAHTTGMDPEISAILKSILTNGGNFNQGAFQGRLESARTGLEHQRSAEMDTLSALLAERGLTGSGAEVEGLSRLGGKLGESYGANLQSLFADEASAADERYSDALKLLTNTSESALDRQFQGSEGAAERTLRQYIADQGNELDWNKFLANFGLDREKTEWDWEHSGTSDLLELLKIIYGGAQIGAGGYR